MILIGSLPSILSDPESMTLNLGLLGMGPELKSHRMDGVGFPEASQGSTTSVLSGKVWLAGPKSMIGGGRSPTAISSEQKDIKTL